MSPCGGKRAKESKRESKRVRARVRHEEEENKNLPHLEAADRDACGTRRKLQQPRLLLKRHRANSIEEPLHLLRSCTVAIFENRILLPVIDINRWKTIQQKLELLEVEDREEDRIST